MEIKIQRVNRTGVMRIAHKPALMATVLIVVVSFSAEVINFMTNISCYILFIYVCIYILIRYCILHLFSLLMNRMQKAREMLVIFCFRIKQ